MKKRKLISIAVIIVILVIVLALVIHNLLGKSGKHYEIAKVENYNYFVLKQNDLMGVIGTKGETIIPAKYDEIKIPNPQMPVFVCYKDENIEVYNEKNEKILTQYEKVEPIRLQNVSGDLMYEKSVLTYQENGKYGIIDFNGKKKTKPIYDEITSLTYKEGELLVKQGEKYGVININGYKVIETLYDEISVDKYYTDEHQYKNAGYIISNKTNEGYRYGYILNYYCKIHR